MYGTQTMTTVNDAAPIRIMVQDRIMDITFNRPAKKNAISDEMYLALIAGLRQAQADDGVHVVLLHAEGDCFCAGNDLHAFRNRKAGEDPSPGRLFLETLAALEKPVVAAVNGPAVGIGTTLLLHCDLVYAGMGATFKTPFVSLGLCPEGASSILLPQIIGYPRAAEMLLLGEPISAHMAWEFGLVNNVFRDEDLLPEVLAQARKLAQQPPASVRLTKRLLKAGRMQTVQETIATESRHFAAMLGSAEFAEAFAAFFDRQPPVSPSQSRW
jgi:enoyl-CoA hydratase/carnithine racemase